MFQVATHVRIAYTKTRFFHSEWEEAPTKGNQTRKPSDNPYFAKFVINIYSV